MLFLIPLQQSSAGNKADADRKTRRKILDNAPFRVKCKLLLSLARPELLESEVASIQHATIAAAVADVKGQILIKISAAQQKKEESAAEITGEQQDEASSSLTTLRPHCALCDTLLTRRALSPRDSPGSTRVHRDHACRGV